LKEAKISLEVDKDTLLVPPVPRTGLPLEADVQVKLLKQFAVSLSKYIEPTTDHDPKLNHGVGATHDLKARIIPIPEAEQDLLDLGVDCLTQSQRVRSGKICPKIQK